MLSQQVLFRTEIFPSLSWMQQRLNLEPTCKASCLSLSYGSFLCAHNSIPLLAAHLVSNSQPNAQNSSLPLNTDLLSRMLFESNSSNTKYLRWQGLLCDVISQQFFWAIFSGLRLQRAIPQGTLYVTGSCQAVSIRVHVVVAAATSNKIYIISLYPVIPIIPLKRQ